MPADAIDLLKLKMRFKLKFLLHNMFLADQRFLRNCGRYIARLNKRITAASRYSDAILKSDCSVFDRAILKKAERLTKDDGLEENVKMKADHVCFLASTIYDTGGHTELIVRMLALLKDFKTHFIEANCCGGKSGPLAPHKTKLIEELAQTQILVRDKNIHKSVLSLYNAMLATKAKNIFVFIHPEDAISTAVLGLLKKRTDAHIIFIPHADHYLNLGMEFSDVILGGRAVTHARLPCYAEKFVPCPNIPDFNGNFSFTKDEIAAERSRLGIAGEDYVSLTGCSAYKIFTDPALEYWHMMKKVLCAEPRLKHLFISDLGPKELSGLETIFADAPDALKRIIFLKQGARYKLYVEMMDVFIDSFPVGSSLAHLDAISANKITVIKINRDNPNFSFEACLYDGYEYAVDDAGQMHDKILHLLKDEAAREEIKNKISQYYKESYSPEVFKMKYTSVMSP